MIRHAGRGLLASFSVLLLLLAWACGELPSPDMLSRPLDHEVDSRCAGRLVPTAGIGMAQGESALDAAAVAALDRLWADELRLGELTIADIPVLIFTGEVAPLGPGVLGSLGISLLREFDVQIDYGRKRVRLDPPGTAPHRSAGGLRLELPFENMGGALIVEGRLGSGPALPLLFDTGASGLFLDPGVVRVQFGLSPDDLPSRTVVGAAGHELSNPVFELPAPLHLGGQAMPVTEAFIDPLMPARAAGMRIDIRGTLAPPVVGRYVLDFRRQVLTIVGGGG
jgi:hypothetical protein